MFRDRLGTSSAEFLWAVGIENTFVPQTRAGHRPLDEYELLDHYRLWRDDLDKAADLGISAIRYGIPWYGSSPPEAGSTGRGRTGCWNTSSRSRG